jgi:hypothetical protein
MKPIDLLSIIIEAPEKNPTPKRSSMRSQASAPWHVGKYFRLSQRLKNSPLGHLKKRSKPLVKRPPRHYKITDLFPSKRFFLNTGHYLEKYQKVHEHWNIKRKIQSKEKQRNLHALREVFEIFEQKNEKDQEEWNSKVQSKINKDIMTPIDTISRVLIDREKWMAKML